jgi:thiol-disulfide isomerase/thioredoxin
MSFPGRTDRHTFSACRVRSKPVPPSGEQTIRLPADLEGCRTSLLPFPFHESFARQAAAFFRLSVRAVLNDRPMKRALLPIALAVAVAAVPAEGNAAQRAGSKHSALTGVNDRFTAENNPWFNSPPLTGALLHGKVVLVNFWTYSCINSLRALPYTRGWAARYGNAGLVVIGVHTPEFAFEREPANVEQAVRDLKVLYPVVMDSDYKIWTAFGNEYWPAFYLVDGKGRIHYEHFGEGEYAKTERVIQEVLRENGAADPSSGTVSISAAGVQAAPDWADEKSPETYVGYGHGTESFASLERLTRDAPKTYSAPSNPSLNQWGFDGTWTVGAETGVLASAPGKIVFRFHSRDLHLVLGPRTNGQPVRFKVTLDGAGPKDEHGADSAPDGTGVVREPRLYQLIRQRGQIEDRTFAIEFLDPGVRAYVFTFG